VYMVLIVCLVLSHLSRLQWLIALGYNYLTRPRPQLIPYFDAEGVFFPISTMYYNTPFSRAVNWDG
jgi:hypothetical protein